MSFQMSCRIYWEDTDAGGVVYYANYLKFAERARTEWLRVLGFDQSALEGAFVVRHCSIDYHAPARLDDLIDVTVAVEKHSAAVIEMAQQVKKEGKILADLSVTLVYVSQNGRAARMPAEIKRALQNINAGTA